jgi:hypothetical protein
MDALQLAGTADREVLAALEAAKKLPLLQLLYEAGHEAALERDDLHVRAAGCFLSFAAGNLADDLIDGDCDYLDDPIRLGPSTQFLLQNAAYRCWLSSSAPQQAVWRAADHLARAAGPNHLEVRTERWTAALFRHVGEAIAGRQWAAYLEVLWGGTALEEQAERAGMGIGVVAHLAEDIRSEDPRWTTLSDDDKDEVRRWALDVAAELKPRGLATVGYVLRASSLVLGEELLP